MFFHHCTLHWLMCVAYISILNLLVIQNTFKGQYSNEKKLLYSCEASKIGESTLRFVNEYSYLRTTR